MSDTVEPMSSEEEARHRAKHYQCGSPCPTERFFATLDATRAELKTALELADEWQSLARQERERDADRARAVEFCKTVLSIVADGGCQDGGKCGECVVCGARIGIEWLEKLSHE